jgi:hypothetical protein
MAHYFVSLQPIDARDVPPLLTAFGAWLATQLRGSLGYFDALKIEHVPPTWDEGAADRLEKAGFTFLNLGDGSLLALLDTGRPKAPRAVVLLDSEGEARTVATSLEEFLHLLAKGETGVGDLDDEAATGRGALAAWLAEKKVKAPKAKDFDFQAWLDGAPEAKAAPVAVPAREPSEALLALPPKLRALAALVGLRADDPAVMASIGEIGGKVPTAATDMGSAKSVSAAKLGVSVYFNHDILNDAFPLLPKTKSSYLPYVSQVAFTDKWSEKLPFGLGWKDGPDEVERALGAPHTRPLGDGLYMWWTRALEPGISELYVRTRKGKLELSVVAKGTLALTSRHGVPPLPAVGLLVAWMALRGVLDESRIAQHEALVARVKARSAKGSDLVKAAFPRGVWDDHLRADEKLVRRLHHWLGSSNDLSFTDDLIGLFGERKNQYAHREAVLDDDTWEAFDRVAPVFDARFQGFV